MSKFKVGDHVVVVSITDIDADLDDPKRVMRTNEELSKAGWDNVPGPAIGDYGVVTETYCDYYDLSIKLERDDDGNDEFAMIDADLVPRREERDPCDKNTPGCSVYGPHENCEPY